MIPNPSLGYFFTGSAVSLPASFYVPYRGVKNGRGKPIGWLAVFSAGSSHHGYWPCRLQRFVSVLHQTPANTLFWAYIFGVLWGLGGLTFGLTMRYLGMSLGMAVALGYTAAFGTLMPPIFRGEFRTEVLGTRSGLIILVGVAVCLLGIAVAGAAGISKET